ncbi:MAG TPA: LytTR family DNA-binding domain-containing protein [Longimicrobiales bacterium]
MIRVLIADDEPLARRGLEQLLASHVDCEIVATCRNGPETVRALNSGSVDVALLDIQMPGLNGFDVLNIVGHRPLIVFVTAYDEFAVRAFEERALDYLLKPVQQRRFDEMMQRVRAQLARRTGAVLSVPTATGDLLLDESEVDWIEAADYCAIIYSRGKRYLVRESLKSLEQRLDAEHFMRVHRGAIVRTERVREVRRESVVLRDGTNVPVSRRRREEVLARLRV